MALFLSSGSHLSSVDLKVYSLGQVSIQKMGCSVVPLTAVSYFSSKQRDLSKRKGGMYSTELN